MDANKVSTLSTARVIPDHIADKFDELQRRHAAILVTQKASMEQVMEITREQMEALTRESDAVWAEMVDAVGLEKGQQYNVTAGHRPAYVVNAQELMAFQAQEQAENVAAAAGSVDQAQA